jgi:hypothetical protein
MTDIQLLDELTEILIFYPTKLSNKYKVMGIEREGE